MLLTRDSPRIARAAARVRRAGGERLVRYLVIGLVATSIDAALFLTLHDLAHLTVGIAQAVSVSVAVMFSFAANVRHNFQVTDRLPLRLVSFILVCVTGGLVGYEVIAIAEAHAYPADLGKLISLPIVFTIQYLLNSQVTFRPQVGGDHG